jgi:peptidoglycan hydrolase CwlO-like protein
LGGVGVVLFWRGVWYTADELNLSGTSSVLFGTIILLISGVFVSAFIGNSIIISGLRGDRKLSEKTSEELESEDLKIKELQSSLDRVEKKLDHLEKDIHAIEETKEN